MEGRPWWVAGLLIFFWYPSYLLNWESSSRYGSDHITVGIDQGLMVHFSFLIFRAYFFFTFVIPKLHYLIKSFRSAKSQFTETENQTHAFSLKYSLFYRQWGLSR